jgi:hypothetical protein
VRGNLFAHTCLLPSLPPFWDRLPRLTKGCPQFFFPCLHFTDPCRECRNPCRKLQSLAANYSPAAGNCSPFAANGSGLARNLPALAANLSPVAAIYNLLPQSHLYDIAAKMRKLHKKIGFPLLCRLRLFAASLFPVLTFNLQPSTIN